MQVLQIHAPPPRSLTLSGGLDHFIHGARLLAVGLPAVGLRPGTRTPRSGIPICIRIGGTHMHDSCVAQEGETVTHDASPQ